DMAYTYRSGKDESWTLGYTASYFNFTQFQNDYSQLVHAGYSNQIAPGLRLGFSAGISEITGQRAGGDYIGYNSESNLTKTFRTNDSLALYFTQASGDISGLGSISNTRRAGVSFNHVRNSFTFFSDVAVFDTQGKLDNPYQARGGFAT